MTNRGPSIILGGVQWGEERYPVLWHWEPYEEPKGPEGARKYGEYWAFPLHRLSAYADGKLDHIRFEDEGVICLDGEPGEETIVNMEPDPREVHHINEDKWDSDPENLEPLDPPDHGYVTNGGGEA